MWTVTIWSFQGLNRTKRQRKAGFAPGPTVWVRPSVFCHTRLSKFSRFPSQTRSCALGSLALKPSKYTTCFPGSPSCRWSILGLLSLHPVLCNKSYISSIGSAFFFFFFLGYFYLIQQVSLDAQVREGTMKMGVRLGGRWTQAKKAGNYQILKESWPRCSPWASRSAALLTPWFQTTGLWNYENKCLLF